MPQNSSFCSVSDTPLDPKTVRGWSRAWCPKTDLEEKKIDCVQLRTHDGGGRRRMLSLAGPLFSVCSGDARWQNGASCHVSRVSESGTQN